MQPHIRVAAVSALVLLLPACGGERAGGDSGERGVVQVVALENKTFQAPDTIPAGWTTFRFRNASTMTHFAVIERFPEGYGVSEQQAQVAPVFQQGMDLLSVGKTQEAMTKFGAMPAWFGKIVFTGGPGLTAPGHTSEATVNLEPGTYVLECYVKTDGIFHSYNPDSGAYGMVHQFVVTGPATDVPEPTATLTLTLSSTRGLEMSGVPRAGRQVVAVHFEDQKAWENFVGHDVHLARLADSMDLKSLVAWMDWTQPAGLQTPAPVEFLGGLEEMPAGSTGYFTMTLDPGRYAFIAEVPNADTKGLMKEFTVGAEAAGS